MHVPCLSIWLQLKDQLDKNELLIWACARGLLADVSSKCWQHQQHTACGLCRYERKDRVAVPSDRRQLSSSLLVLTLMLWTSLAGKQCTMLLLMEPSPFLSTSQPRVLT
jgi:hypothetical protein